MIRLDRLIHEIWSRLDQRPREVMLQRFPAGVWNLAFGGPGESVGVFMSPIPLAEFRDEVIFAAVQMSHGRLYIADSVQETARKERYKREIARQERREAQRLRRRASRMWPKEQPEGLAGECPRIPSTGG
jgi:hypothetical protein